MDQIIGPIVFELSENCKHNIKAILLAMLV
jgi:hypothetical protein